MIQNSASNPPPARMERNPEANQSEAVVANDPHPGPPARRSPELVDVIKRIPIVRVEVANANQRLEHADATPKMPIVHVVKESQSPNQRRRPNPRPRPSRNQRPSRSPKVAPTLELEPGHQRDLEKDLGRKRIEKDLARVLVKAAAKRLREEGSRETSHRQLLIIDTCFLFGFC